MRRRLPPLYSLRAFEAAARLSGFAEAANELGVTAAAIAHQVKKLEHELGVALFDRHHRGVALNEAGQAYLQIIERLLDELDRETEFFVSRRIVRPIRIGALHVVSERLVRPMVQAFLTEHADARIELVADMVDTDFRPGNLDVIVWHGGAPPEDLISLRLMSEALTPVCAPALMERFPDGIGLSDLPTLPALYDLFWAEDWDAWLKSANGPKLRNNLGFSLYSVMIQSAIEGGGIAMGHTGLLRKELATGLLVKPFSLEIESPKSYHALTTPETLGKPAVASFWNWLESQTF